MNLDGSDSAELQAGLQSRERGAVELEVRLLQSEKLSALGEIISGVAHELNNPLTNIIGYAGLLLSGSPQVGPAREDLGRIVREAQRTAKIVQHLLAFARRYRPENRSCRISEVVESVLELRRYEMNVSSITVDCRLEPELPLVTADPNQLRLVLLNLVNNAIQALQEQRSTSRLRVDASCAGNLVRIAVADNGPGIPARHLDRIFDPFFTTRTADRVMGLGLPVYQGIIREHGGRISVQSREGAGARFEIELPAGPQGTGPAGGAESGPERLGVRRILVADDEPDILEFIGRLLRPAGCCS